MIILPAIDLLNRECVRLKKGDYSTSHKVAESAEDTAISFINDGAKWIHVVDLNGAKSNESVNDEIIKKLAKLNVNIETGGGIRTLGRAYELLKCGVKRVIFGSVAVENPEIIRQAVKEFGESIAVSIDAQKGFVKTRGWMQDSQIDYITFAQKMENIGINTIIFTDIDKDGMLQGVNLEQLENLKNSVNCNIIASGGVTTIEDIKNLIPLNIYGAICGKSIYAKTLDLKEAIQETNK